jgi:CO/xanthine dehydrogenase FAD-binding subunit
MEILEFASPRTLDEALHLVRDRHGTAIGGAAWLRMNTKIMPLGVDLSELGLDYIREAAPDSIEIGAMTTYRELETSPLLEARFGRLFSSTVSHIVGIQLRNIITVGGTLAGRYGFSDLNTTFCALGAKVIFYPGKSVDVASFIQDGEEGPFLIEKVLLPASAKASYQQVRITANDFPIINAAAAWTGSSWRIAVGSRPAASRLCKKAMVLLGNEPYPSDEKIEQAASAAAEELQFGSDIRASAEYRREILPALVRRALMEVRG